MLKVKIAESEGKRLIHWTNVFKNTKTDPPLTDEDIYGLALKQVKYEMEARIST